MQIVGFPMGGSTVYMCQLKAATVTINVLHVIKLNECLAVFHLHVLASFLKKNPQRLRKNGKKVFTSTPQPLFNTIVGVQWWIKRGFELDWGEWGCLNPPVGPNFNFIEKFMKHQQNCQK